MIDQMTASVPEASTKIAELQQQIESSSEKKQLQLIQELGNTGTPGLEVLMTFVQEQRVKPTNLAAGLAYQILYQADTPSTKEFLQTHLPTGIVPLRSEAAIDYSKLQQMLLKQDFLAADRITLEKLCELAGPTAVQRKWLYFSEVDSFPAADLQTINSLWLMHSQGKFGFSVQRELWLAQGKNWDKLWLKIGWKKEDNWTRYPQEFTWDLSAPLGHLPLSNQLRGVRVIASLLSHPAWG
ncbi:MAG: hypothetical protein F6K47_24440 [Symploca sp. SIO2E6]|nr:hypothetical protein [Symploca sp. SIO2E6]